MTCVFQSGIQYEFYEQYFRCYIQDARRNDIVFLESLLMKLN